MAQLTCSLVVFGFVFLTRFVHLTAARGRSLAQRNGYCTSIVAESSKIGVIWGRGAIFGINDSTS